MTTITNRYTNTLLWSKDIPDLHGADLRGADLHGADLRNTDLRSANLRNTDLRDANLHDADLRDANLRNTDLRGADLRDANLHGANLRDANLHGANLRDANLRGADLRDANLRNTDLRNTDLRDADLCDANLHGADLSNAKNINLTIARTRILPAGDLIGWKKCRNNVLVQLQIAATTPRSSAFGRKCRCAQAVVLDVIGANEGVSLTTSFAPCIYRKGTTVYCHQWDPDFTNDCAGGIHFFITREEAEAFDM